MVSNGGAIFKLGPIFEEEGQRMVALTIEHEGQYIEIIGLILYKRQTKFKMLNA